MKKTLIIVRHAHTFDPNPGQPDHERDLTPEGKTEAQHSAEWLKEEGNLPKKIVASFANRTQQTAAIFADVIFGDARQYDPEKALYHANESDLLHFVQENFTSEEIVMLVGHNPSVTQFAIRLGATSVSYLSPASVIVLAFEIQEWSELKFHTGKLLDKRLTEEN